MVASAQNPTHQNDFLADIFYAEFAIIVGSPHAA
jgi:hypothetical protein